MRIVHGDHADSRQPRQFSAQSVPLPKISSTELLIKVELCGVCGTDQHVHEGEFISKFPLIPGHEGCGRVVDIGSDAHGFEVGDLVVADPTGASKPSRSADVSRMWLLSLLPKRPAIVLREHRPLRYLVRWWICRISQIVSPPDFKPPDDLTVVPLLNATK